MHYKTIALELLQQRPELHEQLRTSRRLLPTLENCAQALKDSHVAWQETLARAKPGSDPSQIASEALELAIQNLVDCLPAGTLADETEALSLDQAMTYLRRHTPPG